MATSSKIHLSASQQPEFFVDGITDEAAKTTSSLLQQNHENYDIIFNRSGFHNHLVHHLLTLFALNASPSEIQKGYDNNTSYQRPLDSLEQKVIDDMHDPERFKSYLGSAKNYHGFLVFFQGEIEKKGWQDVLNEYVFKGDQRADDLLVRMFAGFLHPIIHLGFGVEFQQPAIIAEALAQAAVHDVWIGELFHGCEKAVRADGSNRRPAKSVVQLLDEIQGGEKLRSAAHWKDGNKIRDGILKRAPEEMIGYASQYRVLESELEEKTAEMVNAAVYFTSVSQHPPHVPKFDFFYIHSVNSSIFFSSFLSQPWLAVSNKIRLLEWKVRFDLAMYVSRGSPSPLLSEVTNYKSKKDSSWDEVIKRVNKYEDDGHSSKLVRALAHGEQVCRKYEDKDGFRITGGMWRTLGNMAIDSVEAGEPTWVRSTGFEEAWEDVPIREGARL